MMADGDDVRVRIKLVIGASRHVTHRHQDAAGNTRNGVFLGLTNVQQYNLLALRLSQNRSQLCGSDFVIEHEPECMLRDEILD